jgi:hypothetical protein
MGGCPGKPDSRQYAISTSTPAIVHTSGFPPGVGQGSGIKTIT